MPDVVEIAWREWGGLQPEHEHARWLREAQRDSRLHSPMSAAFVALDGDRAVGVVQLHEFELDDMRDRSPWVCGMVVLVEYRGAGVAAAAGGARAVRRGAARVRGCGCSPSTRPRSTSAAVGSRHGVAVQDDGPGIVLTRVLLYRRRGLRYRARHDGDDEQHHRQRGPARRPQR